MIDASVLLNPDYQNPELRAYAFLSTRFQSGVRTPVDCLEPFVIYAISTKSGDQLEWNEVRTYLKDKYGINVPYYMLDRMQSTLIKAGALEASSIHGILICKDARPSVIHKNIDFSVSDIDDLGRILTTFAETRGLATPTTATSWPEIILPFFLHTSPPADKAIAKVKGVIVSDPKSVDFAIVSDFIMEQYRSMTAAYKTIQRIYYGVLVANFLTQIESAGDKSEFSELSIIYDAPVLIRLLGCSGRILRDATAELHETLRDMGCHVYYFSHSYNELAAAIEAMLACHENGQPLFRDTQEAIARGEITITDIYTVRAELDLKLAALGLTEYTHVDFTENSNEFQIDENGFQEKLEKKGRWGADGSLAAERDVMSLALIMRLRRGKEVREVAKARFIFMTHNPALASRAREFLRAERHLSDGAVWPIMTVGQLSTIAWVANEVFHDEKKITKELIANCYAAALPDEDFDDKLREALSRADPKQAHELYQNAFLVQSIRRVALGQTGGRSSLVRILNTAELVAKAEKVIEQTKAEAERAGWERGDAEAKIRERNRREATVARVSHRISQVFMFVLFISSAAVTLMVSGIVGYKWGNSDFVSIFAALIGVYSAADLFGVTSALSLRTLVQRGGGAMIREVQRMLT